MKKRPKMRPSSSTPARRKTDLISLEKDFDRYKKEIQQLGRLPIRFWNVVQDQDRIDKLKRKCVRNYVLAHGRPCPDLGDEDRVMDEFMGSRFPEINQGEICPESVKVKYVSMFQVKPKSNPGSSRASFVNLWKFLHIPVFSDLNSY